MGGTRCHNHLCASVPECPGSSAMIYQAAQGDRRHWQEHNLERDV